MPTTPISEFVDPATLKPDPLNPRTISATARAGLKRELEKFGLVQPLVVRKKDRVIIGGHQKHDIIMNDVDSNDRPMLERFPTVWAAFVDLDVPESQALNVALNNPAIQGTWDMPVLQKVVRMIDEQGVDATLTGFSDNQLTRLFLWNDDPEKPKEESESDPLELPEEPITKEGEVISLGRHRLICGDATNVQVWETLFGSTRRADLLWTDPPYGVKYKSKGKDTKPIANDDLTPEKLTNLIRNALNNAISYTRKGAAWYVAAPGGPLFHCTATVLLELNVWRQTLQWVKDTLVLSRHDYHYRNEPIFIGENGHFEPEKLEKKKGPARAQSLLYGWTPGSAHHFVRDRTIDTVWEVPRPKRSDEHPTMKPVELIRRSLRASTEPGALVADCFAGSGSTMIACEQTGRTAYMIELDPAYCDVIRTRYALYTGTPKP